MQVVHRNQALIFTFRSLLLSTTVCRGLVVAMLVAAVVTPLDR